MSAASHTRLPRRTVLVGDALHELRRLPSASVDMVFTSPPYFRLRDYQVAGQFGLEDSVSAWVEQLRAVASELSRVMTPTGSLWLNLGDSYATDRAQGALPKSLLLAPERLALSLLDDGWRLRNKIVWAKTNPMPSPVRDRLACTYEPIFLFTRSPRAFFDLDIIRQPHRSRTTHRSRRPLPDRPAPWRGPNSDGTRGLAALKARGQVGHPLGKNPGDVWSFATSNYRGSHHATFPVPLVVRAIQAGSPPQRCSRCREPWRRTPYRRIGATALRGNPGPSCDCLAPGEPGVVLDPFFGVGSMAIAAEQVGRDWLGIELNPQFAAEAEQRIAAARASPNAVAA